MRRDGFGFVHVMPLEGAERYRTRVSYWTHVDLTDDELRERMRALEVMVEIGFDVEVLRDVWHAMLTALAKRESLRRFVASVSPPSMARALPTVPAGFEMRIGGRVYDARDVRRNLRRLGGDNG